MKVYLGGETFVKNTDIIGIFDLDSATVSKSTREYLNLLETEKKIIYTNLLEFPRAFVVTDKEVFITPIASKTISRRIEKNIF